MKYLNLLLLGFLLLTFGYTKGQVNLKRSKVTVAGKIENATERTLRIINLEMVGRKDRTIKINDDGSFHAIFQILSPHDNYISYNNKSIIVFLEPNDSLYFTADGGNFDQTIQFTGDNAAVNTALKIFFDSFGSLIRSEHLFSIMRNPNPDEFKESILEFFRKLDEKVDEIRKENQLADKIISWMKAYSKYRLAEELFEYGRKSKETLPEKHYDFVEEYSKSQELSDFYCSQYYEDFIGEFYSHKFSKHEESKIIATFFRKGNSYSAKKAMFDMISARESIGPGIELYLTRACYNIIGRGDYEVVDSLLTEYPNIVINKSFRNFLKQEINGKRLIEKDYTLDDLAALEFVGEIFSEIKEQHQGKVLYIDFWGTWCKPCLREFPYSKALHDELKGEEIEFIYLCNSSKKEDWLKDVEKFNLMGTHYLLNNDQSAILTGEFISTGFPQYMIINKKGIIVDRDADRPSEKKTKVKLTSLANE